MLYFFFHKSFIHLGKRETEALAALIISRGFPRDRHKGMEKIME